MRHGPCVVIDLESGTVKQEFTPGTANASCDGVLYSRDGTHLYFSQDNGRVVIANVASDGALSLNTTIAMPTSLGAVNNGGLALSDDGLTLYVVLNMRNAIGVVDLVTNTFTATIPSRTRPRASHVAGRFAYVSNQGGRVANAGDFTVKSAGTAIACRSVSGASVTGTVSVIDLQTTTVVKNITVGLQPAAVLATDDFVYSGEQQQRFRVGDRSRDAIEYSRRCRFNRSTAHRSAVRRTGWRLTSRSELAVGLGGNNAVALYRWSDGWARRRPMGRLTTNAEAIRTIGQAAATNGERASRPPPADHSSGFVPTVWYRQTSGGGRPAEDTRPRCVAQRF